MFRQFLSKLGLTFDAQLEVEFAKQRFEEGRSGFVIFFWVMAVINPLIILAVLKRADDPFLPIMHRVILEAIIFLVIFLNHRVKDVNYHNYPYFYALPMLVIYLFTMMMGHFSYPNFYDLFLPNITTIYFFVSTSFTGLRFKQSLVINLFTLTFYLIYASLFTHEAVHKNQMPAMGVMMSVSLLVGFLIERFNRRLFMNSKTIQRINQELSDRNELKNSLLSVLSHDINSPLISIKSLIQLYKEKDMEREELLSYWEHIDQSVDRVLNFTSETVKWIKGQMEAFQPTIKPHNVIDLVDEVIDLCRTQASIKNVEIDDQIPPIHQLHTDKEIFKIALRNLVSNAIKYSYDNSKIEICAVSDYPTYTIQVKDYGKGIPANKIDQIFTKHINEPGTRNERGTGLGLSFSNILMQRIGGRISVESEYEKGSCFMLVFQMDHTSNTVRSEHDNIVVE